MMTADVFCGFIVPSTFTAEESALITRHYGAAYAGARMKVSDVLLEYSVNFAGLRSMYARQVEYDRIIDELHGAMLRLRNEARNMFDRVQAARNTTPAVEFRWTLIEPLLLLIEQQESLETYQDESDAVRTARIEQPQAMFEPVWPTTVKFASPSVVFEMCAVYTLLAAVQLRLLERVRRAGTATNEALGPLHSTAQSLVRLQATYAVAPRADIDCRSDEQDALHPLLVSPHFVREWLAPLLYSQALMFATDTAFIGTTDRERCVKAALMYTSGEMLTDSVGAHAPPNIASPMQRSVLYLLGADRRCAAYVNLAQSFFDRACKMTAAAALDDRKAAERREMFQSAHDLLLTAHGESRQDPRLRPVADSMLSHMCAIGICASSSLTEVENSPHVPHALGLTSEIVALIEGNPPARLSASHLFVAALTVQKCAVAFDEDQVQILMHETEERNETPRVRA